MIWQCSVNAGKGKRFCQESKAVLERLLEYCFLKVLEQLVNGNEQIIDKLLDTIKKSYSSDDNSKKIKHLEYEINKLTKQGEKLVELKIEEEGNNDFVNRKIIELQGDIKFKQNEINKLRSANNLNNDVLERFEKFKYTLKQYQDNKTFNREVFEEIVHLVVLGGRFNDEEDDPMRIRYILKNEFFDLINLPVNLSELETFKLQYTQYLNNYSAETYLEEFCEIARIPIKYFYSYFDCKPNGEREAMYFDTVDVRICVPKNKAVKAKAV